MGDNVLAMLNSDPMRLYRAKRDEAHRSVASKYSILGFISSGTYGRVYKAASRTGDDANKLYAIKKFKPDKEGDVLTYTGISQSAIREIALNREISHVNVVALKEVILEDKSIYMVFEYAEHDFLQLIHHYSQTLRASIPVGVLKSTTYQLLSGLLYLHASHILHRDLKPANILINSAGTVKIGDLGLARLARAPLAPLYAGDKVVVTIWYRAPELLLGARHYTRAVDCWAVGCVLAELAALRPIFKGEEARPDAAARKGAVPFQREQMLRVLEVLGSPREDEWPGLSQMPEYAALRKLDTHQPALDAWCAQRGLAGSAARLLHGLFIWDPAKRLDSREALKHKWFTEEPKPRASVFTSVPASQLPPARRVSQEDAPGLVNPPMAPVAAPGTQSTAGSAFGVMSGGHAVHSRKKARLN